MCRCLSVNCKIWIPTGPFPSLCIARRRLVVDAGGIIGSKRSIVCCRSSSSSTLSNMTWRVSPAVRAACARSWWTPVPVWSDWPSSRLCRTLTGRSRPRQTGAPRSNPACGRYGNAPGRRAGPRNAISQSINRLINHLSLSIITFVYRTSLTNFKFALHKKL